MTDGVSSSNTAYSNLLKMIADVSKTKATDPQQQHVNHLHSIIYFPISNCRGYNNWEGSEFFVKFILIDWLKI